MKLRFGRCFSLNRPTFWMSRCKPELLIVRYMFITSWFLFTLLLWIEVWFADKLYITWPFQMNFRSQRHAGWLIVWVQHCLSFFVVGLCSCFFCKISDKWSLGIAILNHTEQRCTVQRQKGSYCIFLKIFWWKKDRLVGCQNVALMTMQGWTFCGTLFFLFGTDR